MLPEELELAGFVEDDEEPEDVVGDDDDAAGIGVVEEVRVESFDVEPEPVGRSPRLESPPSPRLLRPRSPSPKRRQRGRRSSLPSPPPAGG